MRYCILEKNESNEHRGGELLPFIYDTYDDAIDGLHYAVRQAMKNHRHTKGRVYESFGTAELIDLGNSVIVDWEVLQLQSV